MSEERQREPPRRQERQGKTKTFLVGNEERFLKYKRLFRKAGMVRIPFLVIPGLTRNPVPTNNGVLCTPLDSGIRRNDGGSTVEHFLGVLGVLAVQGGFDE